MSERQLWTAALRILFVFGVAAMTMAVALRHCGMYAHERVERHGR